MLQGKRILFVDGEETFFGPFFESLGDNGAHAQEVPNAEEALSVLSEEDFDLLIVSLHLAGMSAIEFCRELENTPRTAELLIVPVANNPFVNSLNITICRNVVDFLPEPFTDEELIAVIQRVFSGQSPKLARAGR